MKVIIAGFGKTGTKSMVAALLELDYKVYDFMDHYWYHGDEWNKIFTTGGSIEDFKNMYKDVDAVTDAPANIFWEEISQAFPDCKIILTTRDEDKWFKSWKGQRAEYRSLKILRLMQMFTPSGWMFYIFQQRLLDIIGLGFMLNNPFKSESENEIQCRRVFRQHQAYCLQNAPKDRLLVFHVSQGWEPLCNFLGKQIPNKPFPHENKGSTVWGMWVDNHPYLLRMRRDMKISIGLLLGLCGFGAYRFFKGCGYSYITNISSHLETFIGQVTCHF